MGRCPPLNWILLFIVAVVALIAVMSSPSPSSTISLSSPIPEIYRKHRKLRERAANDLLEIQSLSLGPQLRDFDICGKERENFVPCYNVSANILAGFHDGEEYNRHCDPVGSSVRCLVRPPKDYKIPLRWPAGRDIIWNSNVKITRDQFFSSGSLTKRLMLLEDNQIAFHSEDDVNFDSIGDYSRQLAEMIGLGSDSDFLQAGVRSVLDIGCGFGSFGAHLLSIKLMAVCIASYEVAGSQVQLALERGLPAIIGSFTSRQLPHPSLAFDMIHCAQCGINWDRKDGTFLLEADRVLKPGGYFVLTSPGNKFQGVSASARNRIMFTAIEEFAQKMCWSLLGQQDETFIWQKTSDFACYSSLGQTAIPLCKDGTDEKSYYKPLQSCISRIASRSWIPVQNKTHRSLDFQMSPEELAVHGIPSSEFYEDAQNWGASVRNYWSLLTPLIFSDHPKRPGDEDPLPPFNMLRNVMDMNAGYGGFNAALLEERKSVWVMNVVPTLSDNTLPLILDRGFTGVFHNWCEPFPTYPRTYDLLHASGLLSLLVDSYKCDISDLFLEMDRILRPEGWVVLHDKAQIIERARAFSAQVRWEARVIEHSNDNSLRLLVCQKPFLKK
ncbi:putative methyltransferase PMT5 isoform X2 [Wolffia australiana]